MTNLPALPKLDGDIMLEVFTHRSLRFGGAQTSEEYGDNERLAELGHQVFELAVTYCLFLKRPMLTAQEIQAEKLSIFSESSMEGWIVGYGLPNKLRYSPDVAESIKSPKELLFLLDSYVGAVYLQSGLAPIQEWLRRLIDPDSQPHPPSPSSAPTHYNNMMSNYHPPQPSTSPPPLPQLISLSLVNQTAMQKGTPVVYEAESSGPPHQPRWVVRCKIGGVERGSGVATSQKKAREEAARQAFLAMGWGHQS
jgi:dsRNA-specific ribonuclease